MPYSEAELAGARDFFLSSVYIDEDNPARFNPTAIDSILTNMSGPIVHIILEQKEEFLYDYRKSDGAKTPFSWKDDYDYL
jgi:hypothetical protein